MTKQEFIKQEYENVGILEEIWDENGEIDFNTKGFSEQLDNFSGKITLKWLDDNSVILSSLEGIKDNNGWNKIESIEDLPKENKSYKTIDRKTGLVNEKNFLQLSDSQRIVRDISHWREIIQDKPPLY